VLVLPIKTLLHPTDFSPDSNYAFQVACSLAGHYGARLVMLHVMLPTRVPFGEPLPNPLQAAEDQEGLKWTFQWPQPPDNRVAVEHRVAEGDFAEEILRMVAAVDCDLIVMGTRGRSGVGRLLTGSVAEEVLRKAPCPVMTVKAPDSPVPTVQTSAYSNPAEVVDVRPLGPKGLISLQSRTLMLTHDVEIVRVIIPLRESISSDKAKGDTIFQCLEGCVKVSAFGKTQVLDAGSLLFLPRGEPYTIQAVDDSSVLMTSFTSSGRIHGG